MEKLVAASSICEKVLSSWIGLIYFCTAGQRAIRSLVDGVGLPDKEIRVFLYFIIEYFIGHSLHHSGCTTNFRRQRSNSCEPTWGFL